MADSPVNPASAAPLAPEVPFGMVDDAGIVAIDARCIGCGYNLRSLPAKNQCTECGAAIEESLRRDDISTGNPRRVKLIVIGMGLLIAYWLLGAAMNLYAYSFNTGLQRSPWTIKLLIFTSAGQGVLLLACAWLLTSKAWRRETRDTKVLRRLVRCLVLIHVLLSVTLVLSAWGFLSLRSSYTASLTFSQVFVTVSLIVWASFLWYLRIVAARIPSAKLVRWVTAVFIAIVAIKLVRVIGTITRAGPSWNPVRELIFPIWFTSELLAVCVCIAMFIALRNAMWDARRNARELSERAVPPALPVPATAPD